MPSQAFTRYEAIAKRASFFQLAASDSRTSPKAPSETDYYYHAALATYVAAWEAYLEELVRNFYATVSDPLRPDYSFMHGLSLNLADRELNKFNTPNAENSRKLLMEFTGYDAWSDWIWLARSMSALQTRERLNEILKVRHSFAHGFGLPQYGWNTLPSGRVRLTKKSSQMVEAFFKNLVKKTDRGMAAHIQNTFGISLIW